MTFAGALLREIELAFPDLPPATGGNNTPPDDVVREGFTVTVIVTGDEERDRVENAVAGESWREIPPEFFLAPCPSPFLLTDATFVRVLPGFLVTAINHIDDPLFVISLLGRLQPPVAPEKLRRFAAPFESLSPRQRQTVVSVLKYIRRVADLRHQISKQIDKSLARYWDVR